MSLEHAKDVTPRRQRRPPRLAVLPAPKARRPQLSTLEGVRVEMARVYLEMKENRRDTQDGSRLVYVLTQIARVLELTEIERRLVALEERTDAGPLKLPAA